MTIPEKPRQFERLPQERFDVLIIGGGITGAGTARDLALRGLRVALIEQSDFASGTSSRSTKLIHGGLRYLEQMTFGLVFEACRERHILQQIAPHLVRPLPLMIPLYQGSSRSPLLVRAGLTLYDLLALFRNTHCHRMLSASDARQRQPQLRREGLSGAALYWDCQMDDARLCLENVLAAREAGAITVNYARATGLLKHNGRVTGAIVADQESGKTLEVAARMVVNATGPWLDSVCRFDGDTTNKLQPSRGSHLLVPRLTAGPEALYLSAGRDDRMFFVVPWGELSLIGTTEINASNPEREAEITPEETSYLLDECNRYLPGCGLTHDDVVASFAGLRPLLSHDQSHSTRASREHAVFESSSGLLSIGGGKYTTYRAMAATLADRVMARLGQSGKCLTHHLPLPGGATGPFAGYLSRNLAQLAGQHRLPPDTLQRLLDRYGSRTPHLLQQGTANSSLLNRVAEDVPLLQLEVDYAIRFEMARTVEDILRRRTPLALSAGRGDTARAGIEALLNRG